LLAQIKSFKGNQFRPPGNSISSGLVPMITMVVLLTRRQCHQLMAVKSISAVGAKNIVVVACPLRESFQARAQASVPTFSADLSGA